MNTHLKVLPGTSSKTPIELTVRDPHFVFNSKEIPKFWFDNDPFKTHYLTAISCALVVVEIFGIEAVRAYKDQIKDPKLKKEASRFIGNEAHHSKEHNSLNKVLAERYEGLKYINRWIDKGARFSVKYLPKRISLMIATAGEHFTCLFGRAGLKSAEKSFDPITNDAVREIWHWHSLEEVAHKGVCYDINEAIPMWGGTYLGRVLFFILAMPFGLGLLFITHLYLIIADGLLLDGAMWKEGFHWLWNKKDGNFGAQFDEIKDFFRKDFHPWDVDDLPLLQGIENYDPNPYQKRVTLI